MHRTFFMTVRFKNRLGLKINADEYVQKLHSVLHSMLKLCMYVTSTHYQKCHSEVDLRGLRGHRGQESFVHSAVQTKKKKILKTGITSRKMSKMASVCTLHVKKVHLLQTRIPLALYSSFVCRLMFVAGHQSFNELKTRLGLKTISFLSFSVSKMVEDHHR